MKKVFLKKYDKKYLKMFSDEKVKLIKLFKGMDSKFIIEHIGSTSVPNLGGKGIVDIAIGIEKFSSMANDYVNRMVESGRHYKKTAGSKKRMFLSDKDLNNKDVKFHYHIMPIKSKELIDTIVFRDFLRNHSDALKEYFKLKKNLVANSNGPKEYLVGKNKFIKAIIAKARR